MTTMEKVPKKKPFNLRLTVETGRALRLFAADKGIPAAHVVEEALRKLLPEKYFGDI